jgi:hypothetical protein
MKLMLRPIVISLLLTLAISGCHPMGPKNPDGEQFGPGDAVEAKDDRHADWTYAHVKLVNSNGYEVEFDADHVRNERLITAVRSRRPPKPPPKPGELDAASSYYKVGAPGPFHPGDAVMVRIQRTLDQPPTAAGTWEQAHVVEAQGDKWLVETTALGARIAVPEEQLLHREGGLKPFEWKYDVSASAGGKFKVGDAVIAVDKWGYHYLAHILRLSGTTATVEADQIGATEDVAVSTLFHRTGGTGKYVYVPPPTPETTQSAAPEEPASPTATCLSQGTEVQDAATGHRECCSHKFRLSSTGNGFKGGWCCEGGDGCH